MNCINEAISTNESPFSLFDQSKAKAFYKDIFISKVMSGLAKLNIVKSFDNNVQF